MATTPPRPPSYSNILKAAISKQLGMINENMPLPSFPNAPSTADLEANRMHPGDYAQYLMDPQAYATSAANAAYDSSISTLAREQGHVMPQSAQNQADLTSWFNQTTDTYNKGAAASKQGLADQIAGLTGASQAFMSALGGSANPGNAGIAQSALQAQGGLAGQGYANSSFDADMQGIMGLQSTQEHVNERNRASKMLQDLTFQLSNMQKEKGQFFGTKLSEGNQVRFGQQSDLDAAKFGQAKDILGAKQSNATFTSQQNQQRFDDMISRYGAKTTGLTSLFNNVLAAKTLPGQLALNAAQVNNVKASTNRLNAQIDKISKGNQIDLTDPKQAGGVEQSVRGAISGKNGQFTMEPATARRMVMNQLTTRYGIPAAQAAKFVDSILADVLTTSQAAGKWKGYVVGPDGRIHKSHVTQKAGKLIQSILGSGSGGQPNQPSPAAAGDKTYTHFPYTP